MVFLCQNTNPKASLTLRGFRLSRLFLQYTKTIEFATSLKMFHPLGAFFVCILIFTVSFNNMPCKAQLSPAFYDETCPNALTTIRTSIRTAVSRERRMAASLIRLHFHDGFVQGCDASILLEDIPTSERNSFSNANSVRVFEVINAVKSAVENICPGVVSCADILAVAARDASVAVGGPSWSIRLGRRDSTTASNAQADSDLPRGDDDLSTLISKFSRKGFSQREMVTLSGAHTIGQARCVTFSGRINSNRSNIDAGFAATRRRSCNRGDDTLAPLDSVTPNSFDNNYYRNLVQRKGLLESDQALFNGGSTDSVVSEYSDNRSRFTSDFAAAMVKMGDIDPLIGANGVIRTRCTVAN